MKGASDEPNAEARRTFLFARSDAMGIWILLKIVFMSFLSGIEVIFLPYPGFSPEAEMLAI
jgi:hypothetical protein